MVFRRLFPSTETRGAVNLGSPEAEAEANPNAAVSLFDVYEDYHGLASQLSSSKFLIIGRKGNGKSAFAEYVYLRSVDEPNLFCRFVRGSDCSLERLVQLGESADDSPDTEALFTWIVYTNILLLFTESTAAQEDKSFNLLREFLKRNSGYIQISDFELNKLVSKHGWNVNVEQFRRFFRLQFGKDIEIHAGRAPFYKLLPHLEQTIVQLLTSEAERENNNSYVLFFDDLDVGFSADNKKSCDSLMSLIRACRRINNEVFGKNNLNSKVVVLLRDDIEAYLSNRYADSAKLFSSYAAKISWYQDHYSTDTRENALHIKRFICKRIIYAFRKVELPVNQDDPWSSLVDSAGFDRSSFKYILNNTVFRPRDLLLFFRPLENGAFSFPLKKPEIDSLSGQYAEELAKEIKNELSSFYDAKTVEMIFNAIGKLNDPSSRFNYSEAVTLIKDYCGAIDPDTVLTFLFDRSVIGNVDGSGWFTFKCRQPINTPNPAQIDPDQQIVVQYGIRHYVRRHGYG